MLHCCSVGLSNTNCFTQSHLLQELTVSSYVPNDTFLVGGSSAGKPETPEHDYDSGESEMARNPSLLLLTGPNYSGKSVYMKQVITFFFFFFGPSGR